MSCFSTFGGSGVVATELGLALAARGHRVHFICREAPRRLQGLTDGIELHCVEARDFPAFAEAPYALALAGEMAAVARAARLDVLHAHYAVPHAVSAWMAGAMLGADAPALVTTLHGTDITSVARDSRYRDVIRHAVAQSDAVSSPSMFLRDAAWRALGLSATTTPIEVIPNFVDAARYRPGDASDRARLAELWGGDPSVPVVAHVSNFRPVKRVPHLVDVFAAVAASRPARLLLIGDGPERAAVEARIAAHGIGDRVRLLGRQDHFEALLRACAVFALPSQSESFGLAALEALASGVPVVASAVGGLGEVVRDGVTGRLAAPDDFDGLVDAIAGLLDDPQQRRAMGAAARADVEARFVAGPMVERYEALYRRVAAHG